MLKCIKSLVGGHSTSKYKKRHSHTTTGYHRQFYIDPKNHLSSGLSYILYDIQDLINKWEKTSFQFCHRLSNKGFYKFWSPKDRSINLAVEMIKQQLVPITISLITT